MNFRQILESLVENTNPDILKVAIKRGQFRNVGNLFDTHYDLLDRYPQKGDYEFGFVTPAGRYLNRKDALEWVKEYTPEIYKEYQKVIKKAKPQHPEFGYGEELESVGYRKALGIGNL
jgi:hypothetical protein